MDDPLNNPDDPLADPDAFDYFASDTGAFAPGDPPQYIGKRQSGRRSASASCGCTKRKDAAMAVGAVVVGGLGLGLAVRFFSRRR